MNAQIGCLIIYALNKNYFPGQQAFQLRPNTTAPSQWEVRKREGDEPCEMTLRKSLILCSEWQRRPLRPLPRSLSLKKRFSAQYDAPSCSRGKLRHSGLTAVQQRAGHLSLTLTFPRKRRFVYRATWRRKTRKRMKRNWLKYHGFWQLSNWRKSTRANSSQFISAKASHLRVQPHAKHADTMHYCSHQSSWQFFFSYWHLCLLLFVVLSGVSNPTWYL